MPVRMSASVSVLGRVTEGITAVDMAMARTGRTTAITGIAPMLAATAPIARIMVDMAMVAGITDRHITAATITTAGAAGRKR